ncbi:NADH-dependent phenylglyoxylate dehydrogenase subunit epsilon [subsurface metagenome]
MLIAAGSHPVKPPIKNLEGPGVFHLWTLKDAEKLKPYFCPGKRVLILGSGFVALQAAWAACRRGLEVTVFELMPRIMPKVLDEQGSVLLHRKIVEHGVDLRVGIITERIERDQDGTIRVFAQGHPPVAVDFMVVATGVRPNVQFLLESSVEIEDGILVNNRMETNVEGIYAAGDVACGPSVFGEDHVVHALWTTAVEHGKIAGANMAGRNKEYTGSLNMNVTEMFGVTIASMGIFSGDNGFERYECTAPQGYRYIKILLRDRIPVGGVILGDAEDAVLLGCLRPLIRWKRVLHDVSDFAEKRSYLKELIT